MHMTKKFDKSKCETSLKILYFRQQPNYIVILTAHQPMEFSLLLQKIYSIHMDVWARIQSVATEDLLNPYGCSEPDRFFSSLFASLQWTKPHVRIITIYFTQQNKGSTILEYFYD